MKIKSISAENFKSFASLKVENLLAMNFLFGYNNSGKSNLLRLIETIFSRKLNVMEVTAEFARRTESNRTDFWDGVIKNHNHIFKFGIPKHTPITFEVVLVFEKDELKDLASYKELVEQKLATSEAEELEVTLKGNIAPQGIRDAYQNLLSVLINGSEVYNKSSMPSPALDIFEILRLLNDSVLFIDYDRYFKEEDENKEVIDLMPSQFKNWLFNLSLSSNRKEEFDLIISNVRKFRVEAGGDKTFEHNEKNNPFNKSMEFKFRRDDKSLDLFFINEFNETPLSSFGTGVQQILYIIFRIFENRPKILLLEEIELNLSPKYQDILIRYFDKLVKDDKIIKQVFITTHSPLHCYRSQDRSLFAKMNEKGETSIDKIVLKEEEKDGFKNALELLTRSIYGVEKEAAK